MLLNHYQSTTEVYNIFITTCILYWLFLINIPVAYRLNIFLGLITIDIALYVYYQKTTAVHPIRPLKQKKPRNKKKNNKKVRFSDNIGYRYLPPVQKQKNQEDFFPSYMTYGRKPEPEFKSEPLIDNRHEYEEIMSQDNTSVLSSFANSFADSNSSGSL